MSRTISSSGWAAIAAQQTDTVFLIVLELVMGGQTIRLVNNSESISYGGNTYTAFPFSPVLPFDENGQVSEAQIAIDNVSRTLIDELRDNDEPMSANLRVLNMSTNPPTEEAAFEGYELRDVQYDALTVNGRLTLENFLGEPYPYQTMTPSTYPGQF